MRIARSYDYKLINTLLNTPELFETIAEDCDIKCGEFETLESDEVLYLVVETDEGAIGLFVVHPDSGASYEIHANILKRFRHEYSKAACDAVLKWIWNHTHIYKLNCNIPTIYQNVINRAKESGFTEEGVRTHSYLKNGEALDIMFLGIKRP